MRKFYIPTSTLNFNNILSSESISPKAFYEKRQFGYTRWMVIPENPFNNAIVLYDSLCCFERPQSEIEDHPMLIEVLLDETKLQRTESFWYSDNTIYLSPSTTNFFFYSEREMTITKSMSESSLETKLTYLYRFRLNLLQQMPDIVYDTNVLSQEPCGLNEGAIASDIRTNKMKGLLYGYYIGALLSSDSDSVRYLNALREIHNIFAAILSSFEKRPTDYQNGRLDVLFEYLNEQSEDFINVYSIVGDKVKTKQLLQYFKSKWNVPRNFEDKSSYLFYLQSAKEQEGQNESENYSITWIKSKISSTKQDMKLKRCLLQPSSDEIIVSDNNLFSLLNQYLAGDDSAKRFCMALFNETLLQNTNGKISTYKEELARNITLKARDVYQESWEKSPTRVFLNDLRRQVAGEDFKHEWNNGLLSSIAAVIIAGEDWEKLLAFMQGKEMTDYKLAFAIYGVLNGFANLTRDFTDLLYEQDSKYVWTVYQAFHKQLYGKDLTDKLEISQPQSQPKQQPLQVVSEIKTANNLAERVDKIIAAHPRVKISKKELAAITKAKELPLTDVDFIKSISKDMESLSRSTGIFHFLQEVFFPEYEYPKAKSSKKEKGVLQKVTETVMDFFSNTSEQNNHLLFIHSEIDNIANAIQNQFVLDEKLIKTIKQDLDWVLNPQYSSGKSTSELIEKFREQLHNGLTVSKTTNGKDMSWKNKLYANLDIDAIIEFLKQNCKII